ncbi:hypothetical protein [Streptomyces sp. NPDC007264]|uniref:hypothetical protein n=1 Tax=Streptomyces sp. NPDC007264 TaxID=3364777 RepID=UPI0036DC5531
MIGVTGDAPGHSAGDSLLLVRRYRCTCELFFCRCYSTTPVTLAELAAAVHTMWRVEEDFATAKSLTGPRPGTGDLLKLVDALELDQPGRGRPVAAHALTRPTGPKAEPGRQTPEIVAGAQGRPFAWVDDQIADADRTWVRDQHGGPAQLHRVDPQTGLAADDFALLARWAGDLG